MQDTLRFLVYLIVMAGVTYLLRLLPMLLLRRKIKNRFIRSFLYYIPYSVLAVMTFPAILYATGNLISGIAACLVAILLAYFRRGLITVACGSAAAVLVTELILMIAV